MRKSPSRQARRRGRAAVFTTATIVSFSFTLLAAGIAILTGVLPVQNLSFGQRVDVGSLLFMMPVVALILGVCVEVAGIALRRGELPETAPSQRIRWTPGQREG